MSPTPPPPSPASPASPEPPAPFHPNLLTKDFIVLPATARVLPPVPHLAPKSDIKLSARMFVDPSVGEGGVDIVGLHANGISKVIFAEIDRVTRTNTGRNRSKCLKIGRNMVKNGLEID